MDDLSKALVEAAMGHVVDRTMDIGEKLIQRVLRGSRDQGASSVPPLLEASAENLEKLGNRLKELTGEADTPPVSPSIAIPLLDAASRESRPEIADMWARLLATAMNPSRARHARQSFIETIKKMDPLDALILRRLRGTYNGVYNGHARSQIPASLKSGADEVETSVQNLADLKCLAQNLEGDFVVTPYGRELLRATGDA